MGVVSRKWVWLECIGVVSGRCCKVYRFPHITYPYSTCISSFLQQHPYFFVHFLNNLNFHLFCSNIPSLLFVHFVKSVSFLFVHFCMIFKQLVIADHLDNLIIIVFLCALSKWLIVSFYLELISTM